MKKPSLSEILAHPIVRTLNPNDQQFIAIRPLPPSLNPYLAQHIAICAAVVSNGPHIKAAAAFGMMMMDFENGVYDSIDTLVVPSSGNTGHGVALFAPAFGISRVTVVMASDAPSAKKEVISMIPWARLICPDAQSSVEEVALEQAALSKSHLLDQYKHPANPLIHETCTGPQIARTAGPYLGLVAVAMGSGGTVTGVSRHLKRAYEDIIVLGVRPKYGESVPGARDSVQMKAVVDQEIIPYRRAVDYVVEMGRKESFLATRGLIAAVQPQPGPSSGLAYAGLMKYLADSPDVRELLRGKKAVFICADDGRLYPAPTAAELKPNE